jgi:hypothetical protein
LLEPGVPLRAAPVLQGRVHFIGFVSERRYHEYHEGEIREGAYHLANWHFFASQEAVREAFRSYPLRASNR